MSGEVIGAITAEAFRQWGLTALFLLVMAVMAGVSLAQILQMKRWSPKTAEIAGLLTESVTLLRDIVQKLDTQHMACTRHYNFAQQQIEGMASISHELASVVEAISHSDRARTQEIMQLMTVIAGRSAK